MQYLKFKAFVNEKIWNINIFKGSYTQSGGRGTKITYNFILQYCSLYLYVYKRNEQLLVVYRLYSRSVCQYDY